MKKVINIKIKITTRDNCVLAGLEFIPNSSNKKLIVINSAMAVPKEFYKNYAEFLCDHGYTVICYDFRGIGESINQPIPHKKLQLKDWGRYDFESVIHYSREHYPDHQLIVFGHSCGGQVTGLAPSVSKVDKFVFTAVQSGYWGNWSTHNKLFMFIVWHIGMPLLSRSELFPGKRVGFSTMDVPTGLSNDWSRWGRSKNYIFDHITEQDIERYSKITSPILSIGFSDDFFAPRKAIDYFLSYLPSSNIKKINITPHDYNLSKIGHLGFYKEDSFRSTLWRDVLQWMEQS